MFVSVDLGGVARGRAVPARNLERSLTRGVGWVPADQALTPFGTIAEPNPWGSAGDLRLIPDPATEVCIDYAVDAPPLRFMLCDLSNVDGTPWEACARTLLKRTLADLADEAGVELLASFEHEFTLIAPTLGDGSRAFSLEALRRSAPFAEHVVAALQSAGYEPETFLPEYGHRQFEITCRPSIGVAAADRAAGIREIVRDVARVRGWRASFAPAPSPAAAGNGVHIHWALVDASGRSRTYNPGRPGSLSELAGRFAAGILDHLPALLALTAPSAVSYGRLRPGHWAAAFGCVSPDSREAVLRIPPVVPIGGGDLSAQFHLEFRAADAASSPHLALAAMVHAGLDGVRRKLEPPRLVRGDLPRLGDKRLRQAGADELPDSLASALVALERDEAVSSWLPPSLFECYLAVKRAELAETRGLDEDETCRRYAVVY